MYQLLCTSLLPFADHGPCDFFFWKHMFSVLVINKTINDGPGDYETRRDII